MAYDLEAQCPENKKELSKNLDDKLEKRTAELERDQGCLALVLIILGVIVLILFCVNWSTHDTLQAKDQAQIEVINALNANVAAQNEAIRALQSQFANYKTFQEGYLEAVKKMKAGE